MTNDRFGQMIDGEELKNQLERALSSSKEEVVFISAYITKSAIDWLIKLVPIGVGSRLVCRLRPSDLLSGSSDISAIKTALDNDIFISCLHSLHAKIYSIDKQVMFIGSSNLTNNGMKIYGSGNDEACVRVPANSHNINFMNTIVDNSTPISSEILDKMRNYVQLKKTGGISDQWPEEVLPIEDGIWVSDFLWTRPGSLENSQEQIHDFELLCIESIDIADEVLKENLLKSRCVRWLINKLELAADYELYFGNLTQILHEELKDDPTPYRKNVKMLLQNMLAYVEEFLPDIIEISRPVYSQKIRLLMTS